HAGADSRTTAAAACAQTCAAVRTTYTGAPGAIPPSGAPRVAHRDGGHLFLAAASGWHHPVGRRGRPLQLATLLFGRGSQWALALLDAVHLQRFSVPGRCAGRRLVPAELAILPRGRNAQQHELRASAAWAYRLCRRPCAGHPRAAWKPTGVAGRGD